MTQNTKLKMVKYGIAITIMIFLFTGCPQPEEDDSVSIPERINAFIAAANAGSYSAMYTHMHPTATNYNASKDASFWSSDFADSDHTLGTLTTTGAVVTSTISSATTYSSDPIRFTMLESSSDVWTIDKLEIDTGGDGYATGDDVIFE